ncbi:MAG: ChrR family anti-sigma-E factor [Hyphomonadaceae bacterium]|jgi:putative transcriptional regulator|nr:ChrR family anti-sigma-E factor [Hyphomonadaceae bacterium]
MRHQERLDHVLMDHAAGTLGRDAAFVVDAHLALHAGSRASFRDFEALGGTMLDRLEPAALSAGMDSSAIMGSVAPDRDPRPVDVSASCLVTSLSQGHWRRGLSGFMSKPVAGVGARLLRFEAGRAAPAHGHRGLELTLVLHGTLEDGYGRYQRGDLVVHDEETEHEPRAGLVGDCICLIAEDAPVRLTGPLGWMLNPLLRARAFH